MANHLFITTEGETAADLLTGYGAGALIRFERAAVQAGPFSEFTTTALIAGLETYELWDTGGATSSWYRVRYSNAGNTLQSDYGDAFQIGEGLIVDLEDVKLRLTGAGTINDEHERLLLRFIRALTVGIQGEGTGRQFVRSPAFGTTTALLDVRRQTRTLRVPKGIAELTQLEVATQTGGAFTVVPTADWFLDPPEPERDPGWPATMITLSDIPTGSVDRFWPGKRVVRTTWALGWARVPEDVAVIAESAVMRYWQARGSGVATALGTEDFGGRILRWLSPEEREKLAWYRVPVVA